jgi:hypothetical protein
MILLFIKDIIISRLYKKLDDKRIRPFKILFKNGVLYRLKLLVTIK